MLKPSFDQVFAMLDRHCGFFAIKYSICTIHNSAVKKLSYCKLDPNKIELLRKVKSPVCT